MTLLETLRLALDALEITHELYVHASSGYGFARPENPHNYFPDVECATQEEITAHAQACEDYDAGRPIAADSWGIGTYCDEHKPALEAITALRSAIEQVEMEEPVVWRVRNGVVDHGFYKTKQLADEVCFDMQKAHDLSGSIAAFNVTPLYATPQPRQWVGLTGEELNFIYQAPQTHAGQYARAIEAALRQKNGG